MEWDKNQKQEGYESIVINKSHRMSESKFVVYVDGPMGYNEISSLRRQLNGKNKKGESLVSNPEKYFVCCDQLMNDKQYMDWLIKKSNS